MRKTKCTSCGFSILEVLIALSLISSGLLGLIALQNLSLRQIHGAYYQNVATAQAEALMERFRADPLGLSQEFSLAQPQILNLLPKGQASYQCSVVAHTCTVSLNWQDHGPQTLSLSSLI